MAGQGWAEVLISKEDADTLMSAALIVFGAGFPAHAEKLRMIEARYQIVSRIITPIEPGVSEGGPIRITTREPYERNDGGA